MKMCEKLAEVDNLRNKSQYDLEKKKQWHLLPCIYILL